MPLFRWSDVPAPDFWSGGAEEDLERWRVEQAIWAAMTAGTDGDDPEDDDPAP